MATHIDVNFQYPSFLADGRFGLGFKGNIRLGNNSESFFGTLINQGGLTDGEPVFGLVLAEPRPEIVFGGTDSSKFVGELNFINIRNVSIFTSCPLPLYILITRSSPFFGRFCWSLSQSMGSTLLSTKKQSLTRASPLLMVTR